MPSVRSMSEGQSESGSNQNGKTDSVRVANRTTACWRACCRNRSPFPTSTCQQNARTIQNIPTAGACERRRTVVVSWVVLNTAIWIVVRTIAGRRSGTRIWVLAWGAINTNPPWISAFNPFGLTSFKQSYIARWRKQAFSGNGPKTTKSEQ